MKERPIIFSGHMVRAILEGLKSQTRRPITSMVAHAPNKFTGNFKTSLGYPASDGRMWAEFSTDYRSGLYVGCPYGQVGDHLWVRETWAKDIPGCPHGVTYRADHLDPFGDGPANPITWKPSIHMPRIASRITLEITRFRVERLNVISNQDILREGVRSESCNICPHTGGSGCDQCMIPSRPFIALWDSIYAKRCPWSSNPWVWVVEFRRFES